MTRKGSQQSGFTLMELMITVSILGILAAIAIPAFTSYLARSKTAEVTGNINNMFKGAASYYERDVGSVGMGGTTSGYCLVPTTDGRTVPATPTSEKQTFSSANAADMATMRALSFTVADLVYFGYGVDALDGGASCSHSANTPVLYTLYANGNLDGDTTLSTFELSVGSDGTNTLFHARGLYMANEIE